jgi:hypothetical protein
VVLLESLLAARGIASSAVLVNAAPGYKLPVVAAMGAFNHVITAIPSLDVYVDSTTGGFAPFGVLPPTLAGKSVIVAGSMPALAILPALTDANSVAVRREVVVAADGTASGSSKVSAHGPLELVHRAVLGGIPKDRLPQVASGLLGQAGQTGSATLVVSDPRDLATPFSFEAQYQIANFARFPGPGAMGTRPGIGSPFDLSTVAQSFALARRTLPFACSGGVNEETVALTLPADAKVGSLPQPVNLSSKFGSYESTYQLTGQVVNVKRRLRLQFPAAFCAAEDYAELQKIGNAIREDLRAQIILQ